MALARAQAIARSQTVALRFAHDSGGISLTVYADANGNGVRSKDIASGDDLQLDSSVRTGIGLPNFPSYTSGHSTFSAAAAEVLSYLFPNATADFEAQKEEAAISRLYGGIHYRTDIEVGKDHGKRIGGYTVRFAMHDGADR